MKNIQRVFVILMMLALAISFFAVSVSAAGDTWETKADMSQGRHEMSVASAANGKLYVFGGRTLTSNIYSNTVQEYNPASNSWSLKTSMPTGRKYSGAASIGDKIYVVGGQTASGAIGTLEIYNTMTDTWTSGANLSTPRYGHAVVSVDGKLYAIGGRNGSINPTDVEMYDPSTNTWSTKAPIPTGRYSTTAAAVENRIFVIGGYDGINNKSVQAYNTETDAWESKSSLGTGKASLSSASIQGKVYIFGGNSTGSVLSEVEEYNPLTDTWIRRSDMPETVHSAGAATIGGKIYVAGGNANGSTVNNLTIAYMPPEFPSAPQDLVTTSGDATVSLSWSVVSSATSYNIKRSTTAGGPYTTVASSVTGTTYTDTTVTNGTTYYYVVTAVNAGGESANSNEASATPQAPVVNRALLVITLVSGLEKEYDLSMTEVNAFIDWYNNRAEGIGTEVYTINKTFNLASFLSRKDYITFSKIETFEVSEYLVE
ncbi:Kelch repeat-containing protein [Paenibacillus koleovorans]|uniref:Kelch repeat-containing protein n=1 Tax=Paenibacillus koleovorans TaxID=121608 RepID=UPI000FD9F85A|nr:kelch repeat-containing protein [Paenibacillus koleovorans]